MNVSSASVGKEIEREGCKLNKTYECGSVDEVKKFGEEEWNGKWKGKR
jgi:hypothetical protein